MNGKNKMLGLFVVVVISVGGLVYAMLETDVLIGFASGAVFGIVIWPLIEAYRDV